MSRASMAAFTLHGVVVLAAAARGAVLLASADYDGASVSYTVAAVSVVAMFRESSRAELEPPRPSGRLTAWRRARKAARRARAITRAESCTCDAWWPTAGRRHSAWCPNSMTRRHTL